MTNEEAISELKGFRMFVEGTRLSGELRIEAIDMAIDALHENESLAKSVNEASELLRKKRPHGEWIWKKWVNFNLSGDIICSECNFVYFEGASKERMKAKLYPFCPNCGADMRKEGDRNEAN